MQKAPVPFLHSNYPIGVFSEVSPVSIFIAYPATTTVNFAKKWHEKAVISLKSRI